MIHFTWPQLIESIGHDPDKEAIAISALTSVGIILFSVVANISLKKSDSSMPEKKFSIKTVCELLTEFIIGLSDMVIGKEGRKYVPLFATIFLYILFNNLMGIVPGMAPATDNFNMTFALGLFSFVAYTLYGIKEQKLAYLKQFTGHLPLNLSPMLLMLILLVPIEIISHFIRPMSLGLRLMGNMKGDHTVVAVFTDIFPIGLPIPFYALGLFVCFMQAFVFTLLSMVYVSLAVAHEEHH